MSKFVKIKNQQKYSLCEHLTINNVKNNSIHEIKITNINVLLKTCDNCYFEYFHDNKIKIKKPFKILGGF